MSRPFDAGLDDGYRVGPDGLDPTGHPTTGYDPTLFDDPDYRAGLSEGRSRRIDEQLRKWAQ
jgi:hypothetical protein